MLELSVLLGRHVYTIDMDNLPLDIISKATNQRFKRQPQMQEAPAQTPGLPPSRRMSNAMTVINRIRPALLPSTGTTCWPVCGRYCAGVVLTCGRSALRLIPPTSHPSTRLCAMCCS